MKSQIWLLDPRPNLPTIVEMVEKGFELSEASSTPVMLELRIRACHVHGAFAGEGQPRGARSRKRDLLERPDFDFGRICLPPSTYAQEKHKIEVRWPAARGIHPRAAAERDLPGPAHATSASSARAGMYNVVVRALQQLGLADAFGDAAVPDLLPERHLSAGPGGDRRVLRRQARGAGGRGRPAGLHRGGDPRRAAPAEVQRDEGARQGLLPMAGEYTGEMVLTGMANFVDAVAPRGIDTGRIRTVYEGLTAPKRQAAGAARRAGAGAPAGLLRRLPGAAGVLGDEAGRARVRRVPRLGRHRLPHLLDAAAVQHRQHGARLRPRARLQLRRCTRCSASAPSPSWATAASGTTASPRASRTPCSTSDDGILVIMKNGYTLGHRHAEHPLLAAPDRRRSEPTCRSSARCKGLGVDWMKHGAHLPRRRDEGRR